MKTSIEVISQIQSKRNMKLLTESILSYQKIVKIYSANSQHLTFNEVKEIRKLNQEIKEKIDSIKADF